MNPTTEPLRLLALTDAELFTIEQALLSAFYTATDLGLDEDVEEINGLLAIVDHCQKDDFFRLD